MRNVTARSIRSKLGYSPKKRWKQRRQDALELYTDPLHREEAPSESVRKKKHSMTPSRASQTGKHGNEKSILDIRTATEDRQTDSIRKKSDKTTGLDNKRKLVVSQSLKINGSESSELLTPGDDKKEDIDKVTRDHSIKLRRKSSVARISLIDKKLTRVSTNFYP